MKTFDKTASDLEHLASDCAQYDLVIIDYRMPAGVSGLDLAKRVKEHTRRKTKVFLMTASINAWSLPEEFIAALKPGIVEEIIQKPVSNDKLIAIIEKSFLHKNKDHWL